MAARKQARCFRTKSAPRSSLIRRRTHRPARWRKGSSSPPSSISRLALPISRAEPLLGSSLTTVPLPRVRAFCRRDIVNDPATPDDDIQTSPSWGLQAVPLSPERCGSAHALHFSRWSLLELGWRLGLRVLHADWRVSRGQSHRQGIRSSLYSAKAPFATDTSKVQGTGRR